MFERFQALVLALLPADQAGTSITPATHLTTDLGLSSMQVLRLLIACDREFSVDLTAGDLDLGALLVVGNAVELIERIGGR